MKKLMLLLLLGVCITACSIDDEEDFEFEFVNVESVNLPDTLVFGNTYQFEVVYNRPTECHFFAGFDYAKKFWDIPFSHMINDIILMYKTYGQYESVMFYK